MNTRIIKILIYALIMVGTILIPLSSSANETLFGKIYHQIPTSSDLERDILNPILKQELQNRSRSLAINTKSLDNHKITLPLQLINKEMLSPRSLLYIENIADFLLAHPELKVNISFSEEFSLYEPLIKHLLIKKYFIKENRIKFSSHTHQINLIVDAKQIKYNFTEFIFSK